MVLPRFAFSVSPALVAIKNPPTMIKSTAPVLTTTSRILIIRLRIVIVFPLPLDSLDPSVYLLEDGEIEFGSKVKPGEARGDETLEEAPAEEDSLAAEELSL